MKRAEIKKVAEAMVKKNGLVNLSRLGLCTKAGIPDGSFPHVMGCSFSEFYRELSAETPVQVNVRTITKKRISPAMRSEHILRVAVELSKAEGYLKVTRREIAEKAGVSEGTVTRCFNTMPPLRRKIMRVAVSEGIVDIIAQGLANKDPHAQQATNELKHEALKILLG